MRIEGSLRSRFAATLTALAATTLLAACGSSSVSGSGGSNASSSSSAAATSGPAKVSVANASFKGATLRVGDQAGTGAQALLSAAGLLHKLPFKVSFADFTSGPPMLQAMGSGSLDVGGVGDAPPVFAAAGGSQIAVVGARANNPRSAGLLVPGGSSITSIKQLKGKKIAVAQGSSADFHLLTVLNQAGLSVHDVTLEYLQPAAAQAALSSGSVDAWDVWSPFVEQAVAQDHARILVNGNGYGSNYAYEVAARSSINDPTKAKEIREYLKTLNQAYRWTDTHPAAWAATWAQATGLPRSVMLTAAKDDTTTPVPVNAKTTFTPEQTLVDTFSKAALIPKSYTFETFTSDAFNDTVG
jgi:sulfonate transport system substrate-binding protein